MIDSLISITENIMVDISDDYLLFLQDIFPYLAKYLVTDYLPKLVDWIEYVRKGKKTELHLLSAENIITEVMGTDNDNAKTVYLYLNNLYSQW